MLNASEGMLRILHSSGRVLRELGQLPLRPSGRPLMPYNVVHPPRRVPAFGSGWITYASWTNNTGSPISLFSTNWVVPPDPSTQSGQTIFLFNGIQNSSNIYQPVLQWGGLLLGGNYWTVASWYVDGQGGPAFYSQRYGSTPAMFSPAL